jgi:hypothetical protein
VAVGQRPRGVAKRPVPTRRDLPCCFRRPSGPPWATVTAVDGATRFAPYTRPVEYLVALIPSVGTGLLFYFVIRAFVNADRNEREAIRRLEEESLRKGPEQAPRA